MKKYLIILTGILFVFACNNDKVNDDKEILNNNALLAQKVEVMNRIELFNEDNPEWVSSFDSKTFFKNVFNKVFSGEFSDCYKKSHDLSDTLKYTIEEIKQRMITNYHSNNDTVADEPKPDFSELKEIIFKEEWVFNKEKLIFEINVNAWIPIRVYYRFDDIKKEDTRYKMITVFKNTKESEQKKIIAENYIYVFNFYDEYMERTGIDKKGFFKFILKNIETGKIKAYDPIYLVDKSKREFTGEQLKNYAGISLDPEEFSDEVDKMIFVEDWYFDEKTFNISKKVKGIGFIADRYNDGWEEKILFFIFFD